MVSCSWHYAIHLMILRTKYGNAHFLNDDFANWVVWCWVLRPVRFQRHESTVLWSVTLLLTYRQCTACSILTAGCSVLTSHFSLLYCWSNVKSPFVWSRWWPQFLQTRTLQLVLMLVSELGPQNKMFATSGNPDKIEHRTLYFFVISTLAVDCIAYGL